MEKGGSHGNIESFVANLSVNEFEIGLHLPKLGHSVVVQ